MTWFYVGAAVVTGISAISAGDASRKANHRVADISRQNAQIATQQAGVNEDAQRRRAAFAIGHQTASAAEGSGLSGTNLDLIDQSLATAELDALTIRYQGKLGEMSSTEQAGLSDMQASSANTAGYLNAGAAALSSYGGYKNNAAKIKDGGYAGGMTGFYGGYGRSGD